MSSLSKTLIILITICVSSLFPKEQLAQIKSNNQNLLRLIRIKTANTRQSNINFILKDFDVIEANSKQIEIVVSRKEMITLQKKEIAFDEIRTGQPLKGINTANLKSLPNGYSSLQQIIDKMQEVAQSHPEIAKLIDLTTAYDMPTTFEGRHMYILKISDNVNEEEDEPDLLIVSNHHAREVITPVIAQYAIDQFTDNYGINAEITDLVDNYEIWIAPTWNPDGYNYMFTTDDMWRKNRRIGQYGIGVDQNRNYPHLWNSSHSGSMDMSSNIYKGPSAGSEPETQTMIALSEDQRFEKVMDFHSSGRQVLWGYYEPTHPFDNYLSTQAYLLAINSSYEGFSNTKRPSADGEHYQWQLGKTGSHAFLIETHTQFGPSYSSAVEEAQRVWPGILWNLQQKIPLSGHITDSITGEPIEANISFDGIYFNNAETNLSDKYFGFYHLFCPTGTFQIRFSADGYASVVKEVNIISDSAQVLDIKLKPLLTSIEGYNSIQTQVDFNPNFPNPCSIGTTLSYSINEAGKVLIEIFNTNGVLINTLRNDFRTPGSHRLYWNLQDNSGQKVSDGLYISRLTFTSTKSSTQKLGKILVQKQ